MVFASSLPVTKALSYYLVLNATFKSYSLAFHFYFMENFKTFASSYFKKYPYSSATAVNHSIHQNLSLKSPYSLSSL